MSMFVPKKTLFTTLNSVLASVIFFTVFYASSSTAQVSYGSAITYGLRKLYPGYAGSAVQVRRTCDNATANIGFNSCGDLDTNSLKKFVIASNPLSAITSAAAGAFSLRKVICSYAGNAIQVRSSAGTGTTTANIGFTASGDLDTVALKTFIGANSGFVSIWYDQSGNGRNAVQATAASQPRIVNAGVIHRQNSMPAVYFSGSVYLTSSLTGVQATTTGNITTANMVFQNNNGVAGTILSNGDGGTNRYNIHSPWNDNNTYLDLGNISAGGRINGVLTFTNLAIGTFMRNGTQGNIWKDGTLSINSAFGASAAVTSTVPLSIGGSANYGSYMVGYLSEMLIFPIALSTTEKQFIEWSQSQYYSISGPALVTLPATPASAYVTTWYDQSGNSRNISQATTTRQPQLVNAGIIYKIGNRPALVGTNSLQTNLTLSLTSAYTGTTLTAVTLCQPDAGSTNNLRLMSVGSGTGTADWSTASLFNINQRNTNQFVFERSSATSNAITFTVGSPLVLSALFTTTNRQLFNNGTATAAVADGVAFNFNTLRLLQSINPSFEAGEAFTGKMSEFHLFYSALNSTRRTLIEASQAAYNNVTIAGSKYTPPTSSSYNLHVNGVGYVSTSDSVAGTRTTNGMGLSSPGVTATDFLKNNGDYLTFGMNCPLNRVSFVNLSGAVVQRWENDWYVNKVDASSNNGFINFFFDFSDYGIPTSPGIAANYMLLYRNSTAATFSVVPSTTVSVSGDRVIFLVNTSNIPTNNYYTIGTINPTVSPLPIELTSFDAKCDTKGVSVTWTTETETNNDYFTIERSADAINYETIATVKGAGNSLQTLHYSFLDKKPLQGAAYYRLKQTDFSQKEKYFHLVYADCNKDLNNIQVYPNPTHNHLTIEGSNANTTIFVFNQLGEQVLSQQIPSGKADLDVSDLADGIYLIKIEDSRSAVTKKIVVRH